VQRGIEPGILAFPMTQPCGFEEIICSISMVRDAWGMRFIKLFVFPDTLAFQIQSLKHYLTINSTMGENIPVHKKFNTELTDYSVEHHGHQGVYADNLEVDALIVGAGFAGIFMLKTLRDKGYKTVVYEAGNDTGVSPTHFYELIAKSDKTGHLAMELLPRRWC